MVLTEVTSTVALTRVGLWLTIKAKVSVSLAKLSLRHLHCTDSGRALATVQATYLAQAGWASSVPAHWPCSAVSFSGISNCKHPWVNTLRHLHVTVTELSCFRATPETEQLRFFERICHFAVHSYFWPQSSKKSLSTVTEIWTLKFQNTSWVPSSKIP